MSSGGDFYAIMENNREFPLCCKLNIREGLPKKHGSIEGMDERVKRMSDKKLAAAIVAGGLCVLTGTALAAPADSRTSAERELAASTAAARSGAEKHDAGVYSDKMIVAVHRVTVSGAKHMTDEAVQALLPELKKDRVNVRKLSMQIQAVNDTGALVLATEFRPAGAGAYDVTINVEEKKKDHTRLSVSNTGTEYTGQWRTALSYVNTNLSNAADTLGVSFVTSPSDFSDVKVGAVSYRRLLPEQQAAVLFSAGYGDVHLDGFKSAAGLYDLNMGGKSTNLDLHYQKNIAYSSREKDILDFGLSYKKNKTDYNFRFIGTPIGYDTEYNVLMASLNFIHSERRPNSLFRYNVGIAHNLLGDSKDYERVMPGSTTHFTVLRAGANYQARMAGDWIGALRLQAQYTSNHIVAAEQIGAGGQMSVRGFDERAVGADKGIVGSLEVYTPEIAPNTRLVAFTDFASLANNTDRHTGTAFSSDSIASAGLGVRYSDPKSSFSLSLDYAKILRDADKVDLSSARQNSRRWNLMASMDF